VKPSQQHPICQRVCEIFQACRGSYEHSGCPREFSNTKNKKGFYWNALEKGYKLGFQSSSDHISTHLSYAVVLTDDVSRPGLIAAFNSGFKIAQARGGAYLSGEMIRPLRDGAASFVIGRS